MTTTTRPIGWMAATGVLAVCTIVLAVLLVVRSGSDEPMAATAGSSARAACELIEQVPTDGFQLSKNEGMVPLSKLGAATSLAFLAEEQDAGLEDFRKQISAPYQTAQRDFGGKTPDFRKALDQARQACDGLDD